MSTAFLRPTGATGLNNHPLAKSLTSYFAFQGSGRNFVNSGRSLSAAPYAVTTDGTALAIPASYAGATFTDLPNSVGSFSLGLRFNLSNPNIGSSALVTLTGSAIFTVTTQYNSLHAGGIIIQNITANTWYTLLCTCVVSGSYSLVSAWVNGQYITGTLSAKVSSVTGAVTLGASINSIVRCSALAGFNRVLTASEAVAWTTDPWCVVRPRRSLWSTPSFRPAWSLAQRRRTA